MKVNSSLVPFVLYPVFKPLLKTAIIHWLNGEVLARREMGGGGNSLPKVLRSLVWDREIVI